MIMACRTYEWKCRWDFQKVKQEIRDSQKDTIDALSELIPYSILLYGAVTYLSSGKI